MKRRLHILLVCLLLMLRPLTLLPQSGTSPAPYCAGSYINGACNQGGPSNTPGNLVNDFIDSFITSGATSNINNSNSGCNGNATNYVNYCQNYMLVSPGQVITCTLQSGIIYSQGFAIFVDWNQDNTFNLPGEQVAATSNVPPAATPTVLTFTIPATVTPGAYRLRVRCAFNTAGTSITPCGAFGYGETEDYTIYVGSIPANSGVVTATATGNATLCTGQTASLDVTSTNAGVTYTWTGPNNFTSTLQSPVISNITAAASGVYTVTTSGSCPAAKTVTVLVAPDPVFVLSPSVITICQGNHFNAGVVFTNPVNPNAFFYNWSCNAPPGTFVTPAPGTGIFSAFTQTTPIYPSLIVPPQVVLQYTVLVTPTVQSCPVTRVMTLTINNPVTPTLTVPADICSTASVQLTAAPGGGTWSANSAVQPNGIFTGALVTGTNPVNSVLYAVSVGSCVVNNTASLTVSQYIPPTLISSVTLFCGTDNTAFDLMGIVQNTTGSWQGINVVNNFFNPAVPPLPTGSYTLPLTYSIASVPNATVCPSFTTLVIPVFNPAPPVISPIPQVCNNGGTVQLTATPTIGGLWTNPNVSALTGVLTPTSIASGGIYTVAYQYGIGSCTISSIASFQVSQFRTAALSGSLASLCINSNPVNLLPVTQNSLGYWTGSGLAAANTSSITNLFSPAVPFPLATGIYTLIYTNPSFPNATLCPASSSIAVSVLNPPTPIIAGAGPLCNAGSVVQLTVTPNIGAWIPSSYLTVNGLFTPSLAPVGNNIVQYVIGTSTCNIQQTASVSVEGFVSSAIMGSLPDQCITSSPLNLIPYTLSNQGSWYGPGILGSSFDPGLAGTGQVVISYSTASSPSGLCPDQSTVAVNVYSLATPIFSPIGPLCTSHLPVQIIVSPVGGMFGGANTSAISPAGLFVPSSAQAGNNIVNYSITAGPCVSYAQTTVSVERFVPADFVSPAGPFCRHDQHLRKNLNEIVQNPGGMWSGAGVNAMTGVFTFAEADNTNIISYSTHSLPTATLCPDTKTIQVLVYDTPTVSLSASSTNGCAPLTVQLAPNTNYGEGSWFFSDSPATSQGLSTEHTFTSPGSYSVTFNYSLMVASDFMCTSQAQINGIKVRETPEADFIFSPQEIFISDPLVHFTNTSSNPEHNRYTWNIAGNGANKTLQEIDPDFIFPHAGDYKVMLHAENLYGCSSEVTKPVRVKSTFDVYIPTSFSPGNNDGLNDVFIPVFSEYGLDANGYRLQIFDRWGTLLFESRDAQLGWNGRSGSHSLKDDVYVYRLSFRDVEGNVYSRNGFVTLLR